MSCEIGAKTQHSISMSAFTDDSLSAQSNLNEIVMTFELETR